MGLLNLIDKLVPQDIQDVLDTAATLDTTEYRVFELAYTSWYGAEPVGDAIEPFFVAYMFAETVPYWVRQFTRKVLQLRDGGLLDREALGVHRQPFRPEMARKGKRYFGILVAVLVVLIFMAVSVAHLFPGLQDCFFPPCY